MDQLAIELNIKSYEDWYQVTKEVRGISRVRMCKLIKNLTIIFCFFLRYEKIP